MATSAPFNSVLLERLTDWIVHKSACPAKAPHAECIWEWDDTQYFIQRSCEGVVALSLSMPQLVQSLEKSRQAVEAAFKGVATLLADPLEGFDLTLELNTRMLARLSQQQQEFWVKELSAIRLTVMSMPLREHVLRLTKGASGPSNLEAHCSRPDQVYYIKPLEGSITIIFPMRFKRTFDASVGKAFLQEFVEARKLPALGKSPNCYYSQEAPSELDTVGPEALEDVNGGYVSFNLEPRHVSGPQMAQVLWCMCSFYYLVSCHLKECKAAMRSKMRARLDGLSLSLPSMWGV